MRRIFAIAVLAGAFVAGSIGAGPAVAAKGGQGGGGGGQGCPKPQPPEPPPPGCGQFKKQPPPPPPPPGPTCQLGPIFSAVDAAVPESLGALDDAVHDVLCALAQNGINL